MQNIKILYLYDDLFMNNIMKNFYFILSYDQFILLFPSSSSSLFFSTNLVCIRSLLACIGSVVITLQIIIIGNAMTLWIDGINIFHLKLHNLYTIFILPLLALFYDMMNVCSVIFNRFFFFFRALSLYSPISFSRDKIHDIRTHNSDLKTNGF